LKYDQIDENDKNYETLYETSKLADLIDNQGAELNYMTGEWKIHENVFNDMFFMNEYYDHVLRSAPKEQFRWMLEEKGFKVSYNKELIKENVKEKVVKDIKLSKEMVKEILEKMQQRALYDKVESLTVDEKKIYDSAVRRAKFLKLDYDSKVQKKKYEQILVSEKAFTQHYAFRMLNGTIRRLDKNLSKQLKNEYGILNPISLFDKIKLIKRLEKILGIMTLDIDTKIDFDRFDEEVVIDGKLVKQIKEAFAVRETKNNNTELFKYWYYQLIQMYKNVLGNEFFVCSHLRNNNTQYYSYTIDVDIYDIYKSLI
jgi:hypothetical protein